MGSLRERLKRAFADDEAASAAAPAETERGAASASGNGVSGAILAHLRETVLELADGRLTSDDIDPQAHMLDYGYIDSLSAVTLIATIGEHYAVEVAEVDIVGRLSSLSALAEYVASERA